MRKFKPVTTNQVQVQGGFWGERLGLNRCVTLPIEYQQCKMTGRIDAFKLDWKPGSPDPPHIFWDSDVAKWIEAACYSITTHPDARLEKKIEYVVKLISEAQQEDGYLNVHFTVVEPEKRWSNLRDQHELYCAGHLMEAAVAHLEATGRREFLDVMCRYADYIVSVFGKGRKQKRGYPGHEEIELALVKLYRATGRRSYLDLAKFFVDERGRSPHYFDREARERGEDPIRFGGHDYFQAHLPVREQESAEGHAVRACYLYAGMADVAAETGDRELLVACRRMWKNITENRMYIHGGIGSSRFGERFTIDYDLPNEEAYAETCAAIALVFFAHRMVQIDTDRQYSDVMERALYNCIPAGVSLDGTRFFYDNYLASFPGSHRFTGQKPPVRQEWFGCACCPPNLARIFASLGGYVYTQTTRSIFVHLFIDSRTTVQLAGQQVTVTQKTEYPWGEDVQFEISPSVPVTFTLAIRIPGWCEAYLASVNGRPVKSKARLRKGYLYLRRQWQKGDRIRLHLTMTVKRVESHPSVRQNAGRVALQRGPVVYCLEEKDNGKGLNDLVLAKDSVLVGKKHSSGVLSGIPIVRGKAKRRESVSWKGTLYRPSRTRYQACKITAIPYFMWANRGEGEMVVWIGEVV